MTLITKTADLKDLVSRLKKSQFVAIDTEFMREKTYWPQLCLIQIAGEDDVVAAIDPLADGLDLEPFYDLMQNKKVIKVLHGGRQDVEIFYYATGAIPTPLFDTQIAAMVCGFGDQVGYEMLVKKLLGKNLDKGSRFTDWSHRPLTDRQLQYALEDVIHLRDAYEKLKTRIEKFDRMDWIADEMAILTNPDTYEIVPEDAWRRIKLTTHKPRVMAIARELAAWREREVQRINIPRNRYIKDDTIAALAVHPPTTMQELSKVRQLGSGFVGTERGEAILNAIKHAMNLPEDQCPHREPKPDLPAGLGPVVDLLKVLLKLKCEESLVAPKLIGNTDDLELIAGNDSEPDIPALKGWRREVFGEDALKLKSGKLALSLKGKKIKVIEVSA